MTASSAAKAVTASVLAAQQSILRDSTIDEQKARHLCSENAGRVAFAA